MTGLVHCLAYSGPKEVDPDVERWLDALPGPVLVERPGRDSTRCRLVAGLLHGNEPSGLSAVHRALCHDTPPQVDTLFFIGAVEAARSKPRYTHRMLPGRADLNRCFNAPGNALDQRLAREALRLMTRRPLEAALDLHNNSGHNPPYGVGLRAEAAHLGLNSYFGRLFVHANWSLNTLMEALDSHCPIVTIECGKAGDPAANELAWQGLRHFLSDPTPRSKPPHDANPRILTDPVRVRLKPGLSLAFAAAPTAADFVMDEDVDRHNFQSLAAGTRLGWVQPGLSAPLEARDTAGRDLSDQLFAIQNHTLVLRQRLTPIMMTTVCEIAKSDCLFYAVRG